MQIAAQPFMPTESLKRARFAPEWDLNGSKGVEELVALLGYIGRDRHERGKGFPLVGCEAGCWTGESTCLFMASGFFGHMVCVDIWNIPAVESGFKARLAHYGARVRMVKAKSTDYAKSQCEPLFDFVYIDADHTYEAVSADIAAFRRLIKPGGYLCGHDHSLAFPGVVQAVNEAGGAHKLFCDASWLIHL